MMTDTQIAAACFRLDLNYATWVTESGRTVDGMPSYPYLSVSDFVSHANGRTDQQSPAYERIAEKSLTRDSWPA